MRTFKLRIWGLGALPLLLVACGSPGEAEDPSDILAEDLQYGDGDRAAEPKQADPLDRAATLAECRAATQRVHELGTEIAARTAKDPEKQRAIRESIASEESRAIIERNTQRCLAEGVSAREAQCFSRMQYIADEAKREAAFDRCAQYQ